MASSRKDRLRQEARREARFAQNRAREKVGELSPQEMEIPVGSAPLYEYAELVIGIATEQALIATETHFKCRVCERTLEADVEGFQIAAYANEFPKCCDSDMQLFSACPDLTEFGRAQQKEFIRVRHAIFKAHDHEIVCSECGGRRHISGAQFDAIVGHLEAGLVTLCCGKPMDVEHSLRQGETSFWVERVDKAEDPQ